MAVTHTRTHVEITCANPYLVCIVCGGPAQRFHDKERCGCDDSAWNLPCGHLGSISTCPSWGPVDGCTCLSSLVPHELAGI